MCLSPLTLVACCIAVMVSMIQGAFVSQSSLRLDDALTLHLFGNSQKKSGSAKSEVQSDKKEKEPFIFLYGKPQYDWVTGKVMTEDSWVSKKRVDWAPNYTNYRKSQDDDTKKKGKK